MARRSADRDRPSSVDCFPPAACSPPAVDASPRALALPPRRGGLASGYFDGELGERIRMRACPRAGHCGALGSSRTRHLLDQRVDLLPRLLPRAGVVEIRVDDHADIVCGESSVGLSRGSEMIVLTRFSGSNALRSSAT